MDYLKDYYYLGKITKKHGLKGSFMVHLDTDEPEIYKEMESVLIDYDGSLVPFFFDETQNRLNGQKLITQFKDLPEGITMEELIGKELFLPLSSLPVLSGNKFYYHEVIGFEIVENNQTIGVIKDVWENQAQAQFIIQLDENQYFIPIIMDWILEVNRIKKQILMDLPEGILEQY